MELINFGYYFSVKGRRGGLYSVSFEFSPGIEPGETKETALRRDFKRLESLLDDALLKGKGALFEKTPVFNDGSGSTAIGYDYEGSLRPGWTLGPARSLAAPVWFLVGPLLPGYGFRTLHCRMAGEFSKRSGQTKLRLSLDLAHSLNVSLFEQVLAWPELVVGPEAGEEMAKLERLLQAHREGPRKLLESWGDVE